MKSLARVLILIGFLPLAWASHPTSNQDRKLECAAELLGSFREIAPELRQRIISAPSHRKILVEILARDAASENHLGHLISDADKLGVLVTSMDDNPSHLEATGLTAALSGQKSHFSRYYFIGTAKALQALLLAPKPETLPSIFFASSESLTLEQPAFTQKLLAAIAQLSPARQNPILAKLSPEAELALTRARALTGATVVLSLDLSYRDLSAIGATQLEVLNLGQDQSEFDPTGFGGPQSELSGVVVRGEAREFDSLLHSLLPGARVSLQKSLARDDMPNDSDNRRSLATFFGRGLNEKQILPFLKSAYYRWSDQEITYVLSLPKNKVSEVKLTGQTGAVFYEILQVEAKRSQGPHRLKEYAQIQILDIGITVPSSEADRASRKSGENPRQFPFEILLKGTRRQIIASLIELPRHTLSLSRPELIVP